MAVVCLIRPPAIDYFRFSLGVISPPLGLAYVAAALEKASHRVNVIDAVTEGPGVKSRYFKGHLVGLRSASITDRIPNETDVIGLTVLFTHEWPVVVHLIEKIKKTRPDLPIILGGEHVTAMPEFCLRTSRADYVVLGEGEETAPALVEALERGFPAIKDMDGIAFRDRSAIVVNRRRKRQTDVDVMAWPAWHLFDLKAYHRHQFVAGLYTPDLAIPILATRGCPYQCTYCTAPNMWTPRWIPRDPKLVVDEIEHYVRVYGARNFPFSDLTAIVRKDWIISFCEELGARGLDISWQLSSGTRTESIDSEVALWLKKTGMIGMSYAPESGSEITRRLIKKKVKEDRLFESIRAAAAADLNVSVFMVIGFPHDRPEHLAENMGFIDRLVENGITDLGVGHFMMLPGTEMFHSMYDAGLIRLDRAYFRHILDSQGLIPSQSYTPELSRWSLFLWKMKMQLRFYGRKAVKHKGPRLVDMARQVVGVFGGGKNRETRLQTAVRHALASAWQSVMCVFRPRWMPRKDEEAMFAGWDQVYRDIRMWKLSENIVARAPADTAELHLKNVIPALDAEHRGYRLLATEE